MGRRGAKVKKKMTMPEFWLALAELQENWEMGFEGNKIVLWEIPRVGHSTIFDPVTTVAYNKVRTRLPTLYDYCRILNLQFNDGERVTYAANDRNSPHRRTRRKILRAFRLKELC